jgi:hypothetical protein
LELKNNVSREGEKHFRKRGGINIVFGPKYRPLLFTVVPYPYYDLVILVFKRKSPNY